MKAFLALLGATLFLGTCLTLHFSKDCFYFIPIYALSLYHLYRINYSKGFFLIFLAEPDKKDSVKVRIGPTELEAKDDAERNEDKFLELFDWKKAFARRAFSWTLFSTSIFFLFYTYKLEISLETILPLLICMCLMRVIAVGHLLVPLALNLFGTLRIIAEYNVFENTILFLYGVLFVVNLALIYPSEDRLGGKLREWLKGKWVEVAGTLALIMITFMAAWFLVKDFKMKKEEPEITKEEIQKETQKVERLQSSLKNMMNTGLMKDRKLLNQTTKLSEKLKGSIDKSEWKGIKEKSETLEKDFNNKLVWGPCPEMTPELLNDMKKYLSSRGPNEIDENMEKKIQDFMKKAENFKGTGGDELISEYRDMKFGNGGFFKEQTEFDHSPVSQGSEDRLKEIQKAEDKKKEISEKLAQNIEEIKKSPDEGLQAVNKALKDELDKVDSLAGDERELMQKELQKSHEIEKSLESRASNELKEKLKTLGEENRQLSNEITPHMKASEKSQMAEKILKHQKKVESAGREVKEQIASEINKAETEEKPDQEFDSGKFFKKLLRFGAIGIIGFLLMWFYNRMSKKGVKKVRGIPEEVKDGLSEELKAIARKKLSPREEVIETYNVFHDGLKTLIFTNETPPSCIVYDGIKAAEPELDKPTYTVTETFAKTLYGERDVTIPELKAFRKDVRKVFSFFDITY